MWPTNLVNNGNLQRQRFITNSNGVLPGQNQVSGVRQPDGNDRTLTNVIFFGGNTNLTPTGRDQGVMSREDQVRAGQGVYDRENQVRTGRTQQQVRPQVLQTNINQAPVTR